MVLESSLHVFGDGVGSSCNISYVLAVMPQMSSEVNEVMIDIEAFLHPIWCM